MTDPTRTGNCGEPAPLTAVKGASSPQFPVFVGCEAENYTKRTCNLFATPVEIHLEIQNLIKNLPIVGKKIPPYFSYSST